MASFWLREQGEKELLLIFLCRTETAELTEKTTEKTTFFRHLGNQNSHQTSGTRHLLLKNKIHFLSYFQIFDRHTL